MPGSQNVHIFYFVIANAMLKLYILALYMSQSFYGLNGGTHRSGLILPFSWLGLTNSDPLRDSNAQVYYTPGNTGVIYDTANQYINHDQNNNNNWKRNYDNHDGGDDRGDWAYYGLIGDRTPIRGMESFAFNMGWVLLATILPSVIAFMVCPSFLSAFFFHLVLSSTSS